MFGAANDLILQFFRQVGKVVAISGHTDDKVAIFLRLLLSLAQSIGIHYVELYVMPVHTEVGSDQVTQCSDPFFILKERWRELLV